VAAREEKSRRRVPAGRDDASDKLAAESRRYSSDCRQPIFGVNQRSELIAFTRDSYSANRVKILAESLGDPDQNPTCRSSEVACVSMQLQRAFL
jgi:hypothetical protein